ncbi:siderophore-interacting protein [Ideonella sp. 4Y16]|uniref:Siderophore-interacting protein n=1 Tax=Ideonella alba TaxID=2824118 RepID=A0A941BCQ7_9BURK|nr:siderophore-interacting protein [Ideonella alba]MBQ0932190.1 siderophore-interacting protein [Ideonella alba]MBQ0943695.1 siderophore-interacting protein [Ideonella alba]
MEHSLQERRVRRVRHELKLRTLQVLRVEHPHPALARVVLGGEDLADFLSLSFDDHVKLFVPDGAGGEARRDYTPQAFDAARRELTIEFALHGHGPATTWARQAQPGQWLKVGGPRGSMVIDPDLALVLAGDACALPAIRRALAEAPAGASVRVIALVDDAAELALPATAAPVEVHHCRQAEDWLAALPRALPAADEGFVWCAGEAALMARARDSLQAAGLPVAAMRVAAYWKRGAADFHDTLA